MVQRAGRRTILAARRDLWALYRTDLKLLVVGTALIWLGGAMGLLVLHQLLPAVFPYVTGAAVASYFWAIVYLVRVDDPFTSRRLGGKAERWTSEVLRTLKRAGWQVFDAVEFHNFDIDHVLIGPGGIYAIETKWTSVNVVLGDNGTIPVFSGDAATQARMGARQIGLLLKSAGVEVHVHPAVILWGRGAPHLPEGRQIVESERGPVLLLEGRQLESVLDAFDADELDRTEIEVIAHVIDHFTAERDLRIATEKG